MIYHPIPHLYQLEKVENCVENSVLFKKCLPFYHYKNGLVSYDEKFKDFIPEEESISSGFPDNLVYSDFGKKLNDYTSYILFENREDLVMFKLLF